MKRIILALVLSVSAISSHAASISFTGAELLSNPNVSFPTTVPTLNGSSIVFGPDSQSHGKLLVLPILAAGTGSTSVTVSINLTRLACTTPCAGTSEDHDPLVALGDGSTLIGGQFSDNGQVFADVLTDTGNQGNRTAHDAFSPFSQPSIGQSFDVEIIFDLAGSTTLTAEGNSYVVPSASLDTSQAIEFVFMRNNDAGEQYQINTLSISGADIAPVPIPTAGNRSG